MNGKLNRIYVPKLPKSYIGLNLKTLSPTYSKENFSYGYFLYKLRLYIAVSTNY